MTSKVLNSNDGYEYIIYCDRYEIHVYIVSSATYFVLSTMSQHNIPNQDSKVRISSFIIFI